MKVSKSRTIGLLCFFYFLASLQALYVWSLGEQNKKLNLVILHVNDTHGHLVPFDYEDKKNIGGIAHMASLIKAIKKENEGRTLVLHAGDVFSRGDPLTVYYAGKVNMLAMNLIGYDAFTPGNGEFYTGVNNLIEQANQVKFPVILSNVFYKYSGERLFQPFVIKEIAGIKVAILGLGLIRMNHPSAWSLKFQDPIDAAQEFVPFLRKKADCVIALTHIGLKQDKLLASEVPDINIIVGGHTHDLLFKPLKISRQNSKEEVVIVQAGIYGMYLGRLDVRIERDQEGKSHITSVQGELIPVNDSVIEDSEISHLLKTFSKALSKIICTSEIALPNPPEGINPMGNLMVKAIHEVLGGNMTMLYRGAVHRGIEPGNITIGDVCQIHQWRSRILEISLTGRQLRELLSKQNVFTSGCSYTTLNGRLANLRISSKSVNPNKKYKVFTDEAFLMVTPSLMQIPYNDTNERVDTCLIKYLSKIKVIKKRFAIPLLGGKRE